MACRQHQAAVNPWSSPHRNVGTTTAPLAASQTREVAIFVSHIPDHSRTKANS